MADAEHSKCFVRKDVRVQVPHPAQPVKDSSNAFHSGAPEDIPRRPPLYTPTARPRDARTVLLERCTDRSYADRVRSATECLVCSATWGGGGQPRRRPSAPPGDAMTTDPDLPEPTEADSDENDNGVLSPGSTATGSGTSEVDVSDGREHTLPAVD